MPQRAMIVLNVILWLGIAQTVYCQPPGWSSPVLIDSTRSIWAGIMAVGPERQIAIVHYGWVYVSEDNGRSFELRYTFVPPVPDYHLFVPNGVVIDQNSTIWVSWAWDECDGPGCDFSVGYYLFVSRSTDGGRTFDHVLQYRRGFLTGLNVSHPSTIAVDRDNDVHFIRDSLWFEESGGYHKLIYVTLPDGDWTRAVETPLPLFPDSLSPRDRFIFHVPPDGKPILVTTTTRKTGPYRTYRIYTKQGQDGSFGAWIFLDALPYPAVSSLNLIQTRSDELALTARMDEYEPVQKTYYIALRSTDHGATFGPPEPVSADANLVSLADSTGLHGAGYSPSRHQSLYLRMPDLFSPIVDSASFGGLSIDDFQLDGSGGKYLIYSAPALSYFIGRDITLGVLEGPPRELDAPPAIDVFPNPFNSSATLVVTVAKPGTCKLLLTDILGQPVHAWEALDLHAGANQVRFDAEELSSGLYFAILMLYHRTYVAKAMIIK